MDRLRVLPCIDSDEMAETRRRELDLPRQTAADLGRSAVEAARQGRYRRQDGMEVDWSTEIASAQTMRVSIPPDIDLEPGTHRKFPATVVQVTNETTLGAALRLSQPNNRPLALNFANGIEPGGGFLRGARAQEEVLCRSSALYVILQGDPMYDAHRERELADSSAWAIVSRDVPVFRTDAGTALDAPWTLSFITCAAPYAPDVGQPESGDLLRERIHRVLEIARAYGFTSLVLGAWGCGAFGNDPFRTAADFRSALIGPFSGAFETVVFAITDWSAERRFLGPFRDEFRDRC